MSHTTQPATIATTPSRPVQTVLSAVVNDLAVIWPEIGAADAATGLPADADFQKAAYINAVQSEYKDNPPNTPAPRAQRLATLRVGFNSAISGGSAASRIGLIKGAFDDLVAEHDDVKKIEVKRQELKATLDAALPQASIDMDKNDLGHADAQALRTERAQIDGQLDRADRTLVTLGQQEQPIATLGDQVEDFVDTVVKRENARTRLKADLDAAIAPTAATGDQVVAGADDGDVAAMLAERKRIADVIASARDITLLTADFGKAQALAGRVVTLGDTVERRRQEKAQIEAAAAQIRATLPVEIDPSCLDLDQKTIDDNLTVPPPLTDARVSAAEGGLVELRKRATTEREDFQTATAQKRRMQERIDALRSLIKSSCGDFKLGDASSDLDELEAELGGELLALIFSDLDERLHNIQVAVDEGGEQLAKGMNKRHAPPVPLDYLATSCAALVKEAKEVAPFLDDATELLEGATNLSQTINKGLGKNEGKPDQETLLDLFKRIEAFRGTLAKQRALVDGDIQKRSLNRDSLLQRAAAGDPATMPPGFGTAALAQKRGAVRTTLGNAMSAAIDDTVIETARGQVESFEADLALARTIATSWDSSERRFAVVTKDARDPIKAELTRRRQAVLAAGPADFTATLKLCDSLADLLKSAGEEKQKQFAATETLGAVVVTGAEKLDPDGLKAAYDALGPDAIAACQPAELKTLCACFHKAKKADLEALRALVDEGLGAEGKVFAKLARSGDTDGILELARGYAGDGNKGDRARLRGLVQEGGLGGAPTVLDDLLGYGVGAAQATDKDARRKGNVAQIKAVGTAFGDADGPGRMRALVEDCGLGRPRAGDPAKPGVMAELLNGEKAFAGSATDLRGFADGYGGTTAADATDRARLKGLIDAGGFGDKPKALGPLVKAAGAPGMKAVGTAFKEPADRGKLKTLLNAGGMSGEASSGGPQQHEYPDTLGKVYQGGLGGDAGLLKRFAGVFGDTAGHARQCKGMMDSWNEFGPAHSGKRQPGVQIGKLRNDRGLSVEEMQTSFAHNLDRVPQGQQRTLATRFAPNFANEFVGNNNALPKPTNLGADPNANDVLAAFILKRHMPRYAVRHGNPAQQLQNLNTYFPVDGDDQELADIIEEGLNATATLPPLGIQSHPVASRAMTIETIVGTVGGMIKHCQATGGPAPPDPGEIATFSRDEANAIFDAVKLP